MTTRRHILAGLGGAALLTACREPVARLTADRAAVPDLVLADTTSGLVTLLGERMDRHGLAIAAPDGSRVYTATPLDGNATTLSTVESSTGREMERARLAGRWMPRVVSPSGRLVVLTPAGAGSSGVASAGAAGQPVARTRSRIMIAGSGGAVHDVHLTGNFEPDAVTYDETGVFVLEWLPATAPDHYRVRLMEFGTGTPQPLLTRNKVAVPAGAEEEMRGEGRQAVLHPTGHILYTLYTHQPDHRHTRNILAGRRSDVHAFVHVLHLAERWAYCLDLPAPFGQGPAAGHALALSPDGSRLMVVDATAGRLALADAAALTISRVVALPPVGGTASVAAGAGSCFVAAGEWIHVVDSAAGAVAGTWRAGGAVHGLGVSRDGARLYVGRPDGIAWLDSRAGAQLGSVPVAGILSLRCAR
ncbi:MAG TPA: hypothetical protein VF462_11370 [Micromonosporaceae bacterium]